MSSLMNVELSEAFRTGSLNSAMFKDVPQMDDSELRCLYQFMQNVQAGMPLCGKNKPSWKNDNKSEIPNSGAYKAGKYWHYHCGPYNPTDTKNYPEILYLEMNIQGKTSKAVIHYQKISKNHIFIVGYSPEHVPFPSAAALFNPILQRAK